MQSAVIIVDVAVIFTDWQSFMKMEELNTLQPSPKWWYKGITMMEQILKMVLKSSQCNCVIQETLGLFILC